MNLNQIIRQYGPNCLTPRLMIETRDGASEEQPIGRFDVGRVFYDETNDAFVLSVLPHDTEVDMVASGYEWTCPACDEPNHEIETKTSVTCPNCGSRFKVDAIEHAIGK